MIPPDMLNAGSEIRSIRRMYRPKNMKNTNTNKAINNSRMMIRGCRLGSVSFKMHKKAGTFPTGSNTRKSNNVAERTVIKT